MWRDEAVTYEVAHRPLGELGELLGRIDAVHGLYYLLMHAVFALWDGGLTALRLPSVAGAALAAAGIGATGARLGPVSQFPSSARRAGRAASGACSRRAGPWPSYWMYVGQGPVRRECVHGVARQTGIERQALAGWRAGVCAGAVFAVLPAVQQYAQEGRSYALVCAAVTWGGYFLLRALARPAAVGWWCAYAAALALACWLHEFAVLALLAHGVTLRRLRVPAWVGVRWGLAAGAVVVAVSPLVLVSLGQSEEQLGWLGRPGPEVWAGFLLVAGAGVLLARWAGRRPGGGAGSGAVLAAWAVPLLVLPAGVLLLVSLVRPYYVDRYALYGLAGLALPAGVALGRGGAGARRGGGGGVWPAGGCGGGGSGRAGALVGACAGAGEPEGRRGGRRGGGRAGRAAGGRGGVPAGAAAGVVAVGAGGLRAAGRSGARRESACLSVASGHRTVRGRGASATARRRPGRRPERSARRAARSRSARGGQAGGAGAVVRGVRAYGGVGGSRHGVRAAGALRGCSSPPPPLPFPSSRGAAPLTPDVRMGGWSLAQFPAPLQARGRGHFSRPRGGAAQTIQSRAPGGARGTARPATTHPQAPYNTPPRAMRGRMAKAAVPGIGGPPPSAEVVLPSSAERKRLSTSGGSARSSTRRRGCRSGSSCSPGPT